MLDVTQREITMHGYLRDSFNAEDIEIYIQRMHKHFSSTMNVGEKSIRILCQELIRAKNGLEKASELRNTSLVVNEKSKEIGIPMDIEQHADDALVIPMLVFFENLGWNVVNVPGLHKSVEASSFKNFVSGYLFELTTDQVISTITHEKDKPFQNGRSCARYELLKACLPQAYQSYISNVDRAITGDGKKLRGMLKAAIEQHYTEIERDAIHDLFKVAARSVRDHKRKNFLFRKFLPTFDDILNKSKRVKKIEKRNKRGKVDTTYERVTPTKVDSLSTITPFEKPALHEIYNCVYEQMRELRSLYDKDISELINRPNNKTLEGTISRDISYYEKRIQEIFTSEWRIKQQVLSSTRSREQRVSDDAHNSVQEVITRTRSRLSTVTDIDTYKAMIADIGKPRWIPTNLPGCHELGERNLIDAVLNHPRKFPRLKEILECEKKEKKPEIAERDLSAYKNSFQAFEEEENREILERIERYNISVPLKLKNELVSRIRDHEINEYELDAKEIFDILQKIKDK
jgi:hypothetical protein